MERWWMWSNTTPTADEAAKEIAIDLADDLADEDKDKMERWMWSNTTAPTNTSADEAADVASVEESVDEPVLEFGIESAREAANEATKLMTQPMILLKKYIIIAMNSTFILNWQNCKYSLLYLVVLSFEIELKLIVSIASKSLHNRYSICSICSIFINEKSNLSIK
jgi:hypothetical protein